ncbi:MAG: hypothetical protein ACHREM_25205 [Polyangiales bacterium]
MRASTSLILFAAAGVPACVALLAGCAPRRPATSARPVATVTAPTPMPTATPAPAPTPTVVAAPTPTPTATPVPAATVPLPAPPTIAVPPIASLPTPAPTGSWPVPGAPGALPPGLDPTIVDQFARRAAELGLPLPPAPAPTPATPAVDPIDATLKASAAKYASGYAPATPVGRAKLKQGEQAGMNVEMEAGKCYVVIGAAAAGVTQLGLFVMVPATAPYAVMASDTAHGTAPYIGDGRTLCPPAKTSVRVNAAMMAGTGDAAVQVFVK